MITSSGTNGAKLNAEAEGTQEKRVLGREIIRSVYASVSGFAETSTDKSPEKEA